MNAVLVLEDGRVFRGESYGAVGETFGEAVFATGMTGYQETLTDPSYRGQVVCMTAPHIGNTGVNDEDDESDRIWVNGYVVRDPARGPSNWRSTRSLDDELARQGIVGISGVDTRALTRHLRERGAMRCGISNVDGVDADELLARVLESPSMVGADLVGEVTTRQPYVVRADGEPRFTVAAIDLGIKRNTPRNFASRGITTHVLPAYVTTQELVTLAPANVTSSWVVTYAGRTCVVMPRLAKLRGVFRLIPRSIAATVKRGSPSARTTYGCRVVTSPTRSAPTIDGLSSTLASNSSASTSSTLDIPQRMAPRSRRCRVSARGVHAGNPDDSLPGQLVVQASGGPPVGRPAGRIAYDIAVDPDPGRTRRPRR